MALTLAQAATPTDKTERPLVGTVTVTQDGAVIGRRHLEAGQTWHLAVRQGVYTVIGAVNGYTCHTLQVTVTAHEETGSGPYCTGG